MISHVVVTGSALLQAASFELGVSSIFCGACSISKDLRLCWYVFSPNKRKDCEDEASEGDMTIDYDC